MILLLVALVVAVPMAAVYAQETTDVQARLAQLRNQILELRRQMVREKVAAGLIDEEQGNRMLERLERTAERRGELCAMDPEARLEHFRQMLQEKVEAGVISEEQAAQMLERFQNRGELMGGWRGKAMMGGPRMRMRMPCENCPNCQGSSD